MAVKVPELKILLNKRKHKRRDGLFYSVSGDENMEASYPDSSFIRDSNEGGPEESEEVVDKVGEGAQASITGGEGGLMWTPLPKQFGHVPGSLWGNSSAQGPICLHQVWVDPMELSPIPGQSIINCQSPGLLSTIICNVSPYYILVSNY